MEFVERTQRYEVVYGWDKARGLFVQVVDLEDPDGADMVIDLDAMFDGLTITKAVKVARHYGAKRVLSNLMSAPLEVRVGIYQTAGEGEDDD